MTTVKTTNKRTQGQGLNQTKEKDQTLTQGKKDDSQEKTNKTPKDNIKKLKNEIIQNYDEKKKLSDEISSLCTEVLVLTQMVNNMNIEKGNLIKQYKTVITKMRTIFQTINDENIFRTKQHIF